MKVRVWEFFGGLWTYRGPGKATNFGAGFALESWSTRE